MSRELTQLPNGDLWRGYQTAPSAIALSESAIVSLENQDPVNKAMAAILLTSKGAHELTCNWCGSQSDEKNMRAHLKVNHASAIGLDKPSDAQVLFTQLTEAKTALATATTPKAE